MRELSPYFITTASGIDFDFAASSPEMIDARAIAHHLSRINRWMGNTDTPFSVAQHSVVVAGAITRPEWRVYGLLHDAPEFVIGDIATRLKNWIQMEGADIMGLERRILSAVFAHFDLPPLTPEIAAAVDEADARALATEFRDVVTGKGAWTPPAAPLPGKPIRPKPALVAEEEFLEALDTCLDLAWRGGLRRAS